MTTIGLILVGFSTFILISFFACYKWTKNFFDSYWFFLTFGIIGLIYFVAGRWGFDIKNLIDAGGVQGICNNILNYEFNNFSNGLNHDSSLLISKALLLDMCPFMCLVMSIAFICDPKRKFVKIISPWCIFGGAITLFGGILFENVPSGLNIAEYIFVGSANPNNRLYFIMHFYLLIIGTIALFASKRFSLNSFLYSCIFASIYLIYVKIMVEVTHCNWNATGMVANDWYGNGEYGTVGDVLKLSFPTIQFVGYAGVFLTIVVLVILKSILCFDMEKRIYIFDEIWLKIFPFLYWWILACSTKYNFFKLKMYQKIGYKFKK